MRATPFGGSVRMQLLFGVKLPQSHVTHSLHALQMRSTHTDRHTYTHLTDTTYSCLLTFFVAYLKKNNPKTRHTLELYPENRTTDAQKKNDVSFLLYRFIASARPFVHINWEFLSILFLYIPCSSAFSIS